MNIRLHSIACAAALALISACDLGKIDEPGGGRDGVVDEPPPDATNPPRDAMERPAVYKRSSLVPLYEITPLGELGRFEIFDKAMEAADFTAVNVGTSAEAKMLQVAGQISAERDGDEVNLFKDPESRTRSAGIPFRGNPTDVKLVQVGAVTKAYVPLGGGIGDPGNEVAAVDLGDDSVKRITVGIHPASGRSARC